MPTLLLLVLLVHLALAAPATLEEVRVFAGEGHARVLLVFEGRPGEPQSSAGAGEAGPARATVLLPGASAGVQGDRLIDVLEKGVQQLSVTTLGESVQVSVALDAPRQVRARMLGEEAVLVDLLEEGRGEDPALPSAEQLQAWLEGVGLVKVDRPPPRGRRLVVVDAGHGGWDHGAVGTTGTREADIALQLALRTARGLREQLGVEVIMTRETDVFVTLRDRAAIANQADADLFLSIHANAAPAPTAWGIETYSFDTASDRGAERVARRENAIVREQRQEEGATDPLLARMLVAGTNVLSRRLSAEVQSTVIEQLRQDYGVEQIRDLGPKTALFYVLVSTRMPSILFESGFVSNPEDERRLRTPHYQQLLADALVEAVERWFEGADARAKLHGAGAP